MQNIENKKVIESKKGTPEGEKPIALRHRRDHLLLSGGKVLNLQNL